MQITIGMGQLITVVVGLITAALGYWQGSKPLRAALKRLSFIFEDWYGVADRDGVKGRPGVMVRLASIEELQNSTAAELRFNGGSSVKDAVVRIEGTQAEIIRSVAALTNAIRNQAVVVLPDPVNGGDGRSAGGSAIVAVPYQQTNGGS